MEQPHFAEWGNNNLKEEGSFFYSNRENIGNICQQKGINVCLLSGVLRYLDNGVEFLNAIAPIGIDYVIFERTPVGRKRIWVERVREPIYNASYACWVLDEHELIEKMQGYELIDLWKSLVDNDVIIGKEVVEFKSYVFRKKR